MGYEGFKKVAAKTNPRIAAAIGRKKYGKSNFQKAASKGEKMNRPKYQDAAKRKLGIKDEE